ncbi:double-strand break repair protein AddB [Thalassococcus sp. CAU 1522]|uniref:Double-strand break repair protein AddB n=1 Tax=Thalassococcus arenae TaxID=2851652 RepID=A0ABS6N7J0_9RHOB|nr:double-strand break repair protein AddB [Thalassococcus arenae]MBV2359505.1 double-strand break repair protein AddB [Thalassococcus arenae]
MFEPGDTPRVFALRPGVDFGQALVQGLRDRLRDHPPEAMARIELYVSTERMARRIRAVFDSGAAGFLPRIRLVTDLSDPETQAQLTPPVPPLQRRLELVALVQKLLEADPDLAPRSSIYDLADSLASLMDEMQGEGVVPGTVAALDVSDESGHWQRALSFLSIVQHYFDTDAQPDAQAFNRIALEQRLNRWENHPPTHPVIVAGSTGSRGTTARFMQAVSRLPQGALVLPGFDTDLPGPVWASLSDALNSEDHPQYRFAKLLRDLDIDPETVPTWADVPAPDPSRNRVLSLALRPAPVTHQWLTEGPSLPDLQTAMANATLVEAPSVRDEALAIAMRLRRAAEDGTRAALITPDRMLTRQVTSALDRWGIVPDDSAGMPAQLSPPGRFLRHVAALLHNRLTAESLLTLLKHPLTHNDDNRGAHLLNTRELELTIRRRAWPYPDPGLIRAWAEDRGCVDWANWVIACFCDRQIDGSIPVDALLETHIALANRISGGTDGAGAGPWQGQAGREVAGVVDALRRNAGYAPAMTARDYADLFGAVLSDAVIRERDAPHPNILIWGTLEARVMGADLVILGGLNEGSWPEPPAADPWLNRRMRHQVGLLLPERRIGLSAHDFQQAAAAREVWFTRSLKSDEAETVPARWLNRLTNLMNGLEDRGGRDALGAMRGRGDTWLGYARALERPWPADPAPRPSPVPPVAARPRELPVTDIKRLVRDPYHIYARRILRLKPLDPLHRAPDALMRGILTHEILDRFVRDTVSDPAQLTPEQLLIHAAAILEDPVQLPFPVQRHLWLARLSTAAEWFCDTERARQSRARPAYFETRGAASLPSGFTLTAKADRIDIDADGALHIYDYKTGKAPTGPQQQKFDKQLLLEAAIGTLGGFADIGPAPVAEAVFIQLAAGDPREVPAPLEDMPPHETWSDFAKLIAAYDDPDQGYTARRAMLKDTDSSDFDHLSRFGEWNVTAKPRREGLE